MKLTSDQKATPHGLIAKILHWSFLILFAYGIYKGLDNVDQLADPTLLRFEMVFAAVFLTTVLLR